METICTLLQTEITTPTPYHSISQAGFSSWRPTNSVKALKADSSQNKERKIVDETVMGDFMLLRYVLLCL